MSLMFTTLVSLSRLRLAIGIAVLPLAVSATYLVYLNRLVSRLCTASTRLRDRNKGANRLPPALRKPVTLPQEVEAEESEWILAYERIASQPVPRSSIPYDLKTDLSTVLTHYARATMTAFSWTPQAFLLRASAGDSAVKKTFDTDFIQNLAFCEGDRVNGFWRVVYREDSGLSGGGRLEMAMDPPPTYRGPVVRGVVVAGIELQDDGDLVFVNETWMWRREEAAPMLLESRLGRLHATLSGWLMMKGVRAVTHV
ncbi:hypothetical protein N657DRAFT_650960 [Parathielavia appendiculata]|uniref:Uncharacterized protein n=1 Tax=Parathielavia appendiculata TaxID=2587402 RepID=A0AAN6TR52_9PEZI|nr:hypothetical protein N657DRAFT_650960 [Parathielavia appendiculata]